MSWLDVQLGHELSTVTGVKVYAKLLIDNTVLDYFLDIEAFFRALKEEGCYLLFCHGQRGVESKGLLVEIKFTQTEWTVRVQSPLESLDFGRELEYRFRWADVYLAATKIKDYIKELSRRYPGELVRCGAGSSGNLVDGLDDMAPGITLREPVVGEDYPQEWRERFEALVDAEAARVGKIFRYYCIESCSVAWIEKQLVMNHLSGWFLEPEEVEMFDRIMDDIDEDNPDHVAICGYYRRMLSIDWYLTRAGDICFDISPEWKEVE